MILCSFLVTTSAQNSSTDLFPMARSSTVVSPQDFNRTVLPITELKFLGLGLEVKFGTGFCLDPECRFIATNYHVAMLAHLHKIKGEKVFRKFLATGPEDEGATLNDGPSVAPIRYTLSRDLAIFELQHPLPHYHGVGFNLNDLQTGQEVEIYAYPKETINPIRSLVKFHGTYKGQTTTGLLAFYYSLSAGKEIRPGASGGIVVDSQTQQIVGVLSGIAMNGENIAVAVPSQSLLDFVRKVQPFLAHAIFPSSSEGISPVSLDFSPKFVPPTATGTLEHRPEESVEVQVLRIKAQLLAESMHDFIAVQTFAWGSDNNRPAYQSAYEVRVIDGYQRFRKYPDGKKELHDVPIPPVNTVMVPGGEWSELPAMVGTELSLKIHRAADVVLNGRLVMVFQYEGDPEDRVCRWKSIYDFGLFAISKIATVGCYGEVWTDKDTNILRMSEHYELPGKWKDYQAVVTYGWLEKWNETSRLIPLTISSQVKFKKKIYWCRGIFTDYQMFSSRVKIATN